MVSVWEVNKKARYDFCTSAIEQAVRVLHDVVGFRPLGIYRQMFPGYTSGTFNVSTAIRRKVLDSLVVTEIRISVILRGQDLTE